MHPHVCIFLVFLLYPRNCKQLLFCFRHSPSGPFSPPPLLLLLFWQAHAQVIGRLAVSVAAVPLVHIQCGCHPVPEEMAVFNVENLGKLGRDLAQKKAFASPRPLVIKRNVTLVLPHGILLVSLHSSDSFVDAPFDGITPINKGNLL